MNTWKVILSTLVIFIAGIITGALLVTNVLHIKQNHFKPSNVSAVAANPWQVRNKELLRRMDRELDLTPEQHQHIEAIITAGQERTKLLWKPIAPLMNKEMQLVHSEIRDQLTPDQKKKFDAFAKAHTALDKHHNGTNAPAMGATNSTSFNPPVTNTAPTSAAP